MEDNIKLKHNLKEYDCNPEVSTITYCSGYNTKECKMICNYAKEKGLEKEIKK